MSKEAEVLLAEVLSSFEGHGFSVPPKLFKEITEAMKAYADEQMIKILKEIIDYRLGDYEDFSDGYSEIKQIAKQHLKQLEE